MSQKTNGKPVRKEEAIQREKKGRMKRRALGADSFWWNSLKLCNIYSSLLWLFLVISDEPKHLLCNNLGSTNIMQVCIQSQNLGFCLTPVLWRFMLVWEGFTSTSKFRTFRIILGISWHIITAKWQKRWKIRNEGCISRYFSNRQIMFLQVL